MDMNEGLKVILFGASGHAKVVLDLCEKIDSLNVVALYDDNQALAGGQLLGYPIIGGREQWLAAVKDGTLANVVTIGSNRLRRDIATWILKNGGRLCPALVHPSAQIGRDVVIGDGTVLMAGTVVNCETHIGANVIINTGARVDHDCRIGAGVHVAPGSTVCGGVKIGDFSLIGAGAVICPNLRIGVGAIIGAGAVVVRDVLEGCTVVGVPARIADKVE